MSPIRWQRFDDAYWACMQAKGFPTFVGSWVTENKADSTLGDRDLRMGLKPFTPASRSYAQEYGYSQSIDAPQIGKAGQSPVEKWMRTLSPEELNRFVQADGNDGGSKQRKGVLSGRMERGL